MMVYSEEIKYDNQDENLDLSYHAEFSNDDSIIECYISSYDHNSDEHLKWPVTSFKCGAGLGFHHVDVDAIYESYGRKIRNFLAKFKEKYSTIEKFNTYTEENKPKSL